MWAKPQQEGAAVKESLKSSAKILQKYEVIQACSVGRQQPKEMADQWKTNKQTNQPPDCHLSRCSLKCYCNPQQLYPLTPKHWCSICNEAERWQKRCSFFIILCYVKRVAIPGNKLPSQEHLANHPLIMHEQLMSWLFFMPYAHGRGKGQSLCLHAGQDLPTF